MIRSKSTLKSPALAIAQIIITVFALSSCLKTEIDTPFEPGNEPAKKVDFKIQVSRDGELVSKERSGIMTRSGEVDASDYVATMDPSKPFGIVGFDEESGDVLLDNVKAFNESGTYSGWIPGELWKAKPVVTFSAYYPHVPSVDYHDSVGYSIPFSDSETDAGPLVSKTMRRAIDQLNMVPIEFQHITNDIGYKICDATPSADLQGLIHLRKLTAHNVASAGTYVNDLNAPRGFWHRVGYYRKVVVFEGDAPVGVGSDNEKFVGHETLVDRMAESHRYYSIPDEIQLGKQYVEVVYDVEEFVHNGFTYPALKDQVAKYALYGLLPDNIFENGKQYTFHIGLDLSSVYKEITFAPAVGDWETKIYENNDDF